MDRRTFVATLGIAFLAAPLSVEARQAGKVYRVGVLWPGAVPPPGARMEWLRQGLRESGYIEGQNVTIDLRYAETGQRLRELTGELVRLNVDVILTFGDLGPKMAQQETATVPIVAAMDDFRGAGLVPNLARPGGNITGVSILSPELSAKRLELLRQILPKMSRVAALWDPGSPSQLPVTKSAARSLGLQLQVLEVRGRSDLPGAFQAAKKGRAQALNVLASPLLSTFYQAIIDLAAENRLPAIYQWKEHAQNGGLVSYGPSLSELWRQNALVVSKILTGAKPGDLPVEQPTKFELVINLKTAKALALTIPQSVLARAAEVIQ